MLNRFLKCKTLFDLYNVFCKEDVIDFEKLNSEEVERVVFVFSANKPENIEMPELPLTPAGYTLIWNVTADVVEAFIKSSIDKDTKENTEEKEMTNENATTKTNINMEGETMTDFRKDLEQVAQDVAAAKDNVKTVGDDQNVQEFVDEADNSVNVINGGFGKLIGMLDKFTGLSDLKAEILDAYHAGERGDSKHDLLKIAEKIRVKIDSKLISIDKTISKGEKLGLDTTELKKVKDVLVELKGSNIFKKIVTGLAYVAKKVYIVLHGVFEKQCERKDIFGSICRGIGEFVKALKDGLKIVWDTAKFAVSFILAGIMIVAGPIVKAIASLVKNFKGWVEKKCKKITEVINVPKEEDTEDEAEDEFEDEDINE